MGKKHLENQYNALHKFNTRLLRSDDNNCTGKILFCFKSLY